MALRSSRTSFSSSLIRCASSVVVPGLRPPSTWAFLTQVRRASGWAPSSSAILRIAPLARAGSAGASNARPRGSLAQLIGILLLSHDSDPSVSSPPPIKPGAIHIVQRFPALLAASPAPLAPLGQSQDLARLGCGPALAGCVVHQVQQPLLDGCVHSGGNRLVRHQAKPLFFLSTTSPAACSATVRVSRSISTLAWPGSMSRAGFPEAHGREAASTSKAPCLAYCRNRMIVERSTPACAAAAPTVVSPHISWM